MADQGDGEDIFCDDELDDLPDDALAELEINAIRSTQAYNHATAPPSSDYGDDFEDDDLDDAVVIDESKSAPAAIPLLQRNVRGQNLRKETLFAQRQVPSHDASSNLVSRQRSSNDSSSTPDSSSKPRNALQHDESLVAHQGSQLAGVDPGVDSLQKQIQELLREKEALKQDLNAKTGEIAIVRSKHEKTVKEYEREKIATRKLNEEKLAKQQKALEAARIAEKNAVTERDFTRQDYEESERARKLNKAKEAENKPGDAVTTPKKKKQFPHRDGFDDDEIEIISPSKLSPSKFLRSAASSPAKPGKRKRKAVDSPIAPLELQPTESTEEVLKVRHPVLDETVTESLARPDDRLRFLTTMLDHRPKFDDPRTIQAFSNYALPSAPEESFESMILGKISVMCHKKPVSDLPIEFCQLLISLWSKCIEEKYYAPVYLMVDLLTAALELKTTAIGPHVIDTLLPLAQITADLVAIPRFRGEPLEKVLEQNIDVTACLALLHLAALGCMADQAHIYRFWKIMRWDFILFMLSQNQNTRDFEMMIRLLSTSVFKESFGTIQSGATQKSQCGYILERLSWPLAGIPSTRTNEQLDSTMLAQLRIHILQLMTGMTRSPFAGMVMATSENAVGRLVCLISDELDVLYDYKAGHETSARIVSLAVRLLYHLVMKYDDIINMPQKLASIHGGSQKHLLSLTRLHFSAEDLVLERGIETDVVVCAQEMLEQIVTPEEGDSIYAAFTPG